MKNKVVNKIAAAGLGLFAIIVPTTAVVASASAYVSTIDISSNSFCEGAERYYDSSYYYITIRPNYFYDGMNAAVTVTVAKKNYIAGVFWKYTKYCSSYISMSTLNSNYDRKIGHAGDGTRCYLFETGASDGFRADYVAMSSKTY